MVNYPSDWNTTILGFLGDVKMCKRIFQSQTRPFGQIPFYKIGTFGSTPNAYISRELFETYKNLYSFPQKGDVMISAAGTIGRTVVYDGKDAYFQDSNIVWLDIDPDKVDRNFLMYFYQSCPWENLEGTTIRRLYNSIIRNTTIHLPPLPEQKAIANTLTAFDTHIANLSELIEKKKAIRDGALEDLVSGRTRLAAKVEEGSLSSSEEGGIHAVKSLSDWTETKLSDIGYTYSGLTGKTKLDFETGNGKFITFLNVLNNVEIDVNILGNVNVKENEHQNLVKVGDLFFNTSSETPEEVGMCAVLLKSIGICYLNSFCFGYRLKSDDVNPLFLSYYFNSCTGREFMKKHAQGSTRYNLSKQKFLSKSIPLPPLTEQKAIADTLTAMDNEITALKAERDKMIQIREGAMNDLLTGRIRLKVS